MTSHNVVSRSWRSAARRPANTSDELPPSERANKCHPYKETFRAASAESVSHDGGLRPVATMEPRSAATALKIDVKLRTDIVESSS
jgi:hypothetical protein